MLCPEFTVLELPSGAEDIKTPLVPEETFVKNKSLTGPHDPPEAENTTEELTALNLLDDPNETENPLKELTGCRAYPFVEGSAIRSARVSVSLKTILASKPR